MVDDPITFEIETDDGESAELRLGSELAREWRDLITERLENGPGGMVQLPMVQPDGERLWFELPPLVAEDIREEIDEYLRGDPDG